MSTVFSDHTGSTACPSCGIGPMRYVRVAADELPPKWLTQHSAFKEVMPLVRRGDLLFHCLNSDCDTLITVQDDSL